MPPRKKNAVKKAKVAPSQKTFTFRVEDDLRARIDAAAKASGMSSSSFVNQFLADNLDQLSVKHRLAAMESRLTVLENRPAEVLLSVTGAEQVRTAFTAAFSSEVIEESDGDGDLVEEASTLEDEEDATEYDDADEPAGNHAPSNAA